MTDIVERLRERGAGWLTEQDIEEAADEIERLRAALAEYENVPVRLRHIMPDASFHRMKTGCRNDRHR